MSEKLFGTDGIRGVANIYPLTPDFCLRLANVLALKICLKNKKVAIARDTRISGDMLFSALASGFTAQGVDVIDLGIIPTPLCTTLTPKLNVDMSIMITASHNPYQDNGLKLITSDGNKFSDSATEILEAELAKTPSFTYDKDKIGQIIKTSAGLDSYFPVVQKLAGADSLKNMKIVLDSANGAFSSILPEVFKFLGAETINLSHTPNGKNINENCGSQHTENLCKTVVENGYDLGVAVDGDGDRIIICDELGNRLNGDQIIGFLAQYMNKHKMLKNNAVVATIYSNLGLGEYVKSLGLDFYATPVGERYVIEKMHEIGANLGGEESGHMVLSDYSLTGDAMLTAIVVCLGIKEISKKVSEIFPVFEPFPTIAHNLKFADKSQVAKIMEDNEVQSCIESIKKQLESKGSLIVRKSGTEPVIRIKFEAKDEAWIKNLSEELLEKINKVK